MRKIAFLLGICLVTYSGASAQFSGQLSPAQTVAAGYSNAGGYIAIYEGAIGLLGQYRYGIGNFTDIGFKLGVIDFDNGHYNNSTGFDVGFDFKYLAMERRLRDPIDLSVGGEINFVGVENANIFSFGINAVGAYPLKLHNGRSLDPYGRLQLRIARYGYSSHYRFAGRDFGYDGSHTDFEIGFNPGVAFELSRTVRAIGEIQFDDPMAFYMGLNFEF